MENQSWDQPVTSWTGSVGFEPKQEEISIEPGAPANSSGRSGTENDISFSVVNMRNASIITAENGSRERLKSLNHSKKTRLIGHGLWVFSTLILFSAAWFLGPLMVERYHYSAAKGKMLAQYENAVELLREEPFSNVSLAYQLVAQKISPSVVSVSTEKFNSMSELEGKGWISGEGSGVILTTDGYILTNHHVVANSKKIEVALPDRRVFSAQMIGTDELTDLAVLKIQANNLIPAEFADSDDVEVGTLVWAIGNPFGLTQTITSGILSGKDRQGASSQYQEFLQSDAAVNPGNSGGPLVDSCGRVIGINTSIYGSRFQGISFAVPSVIAQHVFDQLRVNGRVQRGFLGVTPGIVFQHHAELYQLADLDGALIHYVDRNTPASQAGLEPGDVIRRWGGRDIKNWRHLFRYVSMTKPDENIDVELVRNGEIKHLNIKVSEMARPRS